MSTTEDYFNARQQADAYAQNGDTANAVRCYDEALALLPVVGFSEGQQSLLRPLLTRRRNRVASGEKML